MPSQHESNDNVTSEPTINVTSDSVVLNAECGSGRRRDCMNSYTCIFRHFGEFPGKPISLYTKDLPKPSTKSKVIQCQYCTKTFKSNHGMNIHIKKMHAGIGSSKPLINGTKEANSQAETSGNLESTNCAPFKWGRYDYDEFVKNLDF